MKFYVLATLFLAQAAYSIEVNINNVNCTGAIFTANCASFTQQIRDEINSNLPETDIEKYAIGTANATVISNASRGSDYAKNFDIFTIKASIGIGADTNAPISELIKDDIDEDDINGVGVGGGLMVGVNLDLLPIKKVGFLDLSKLDIMFSFNSLSLDQEIGQNTASGSIGGFGFMARYRLIDPVDLPSKYLFQWGGVQLHTGFRSSSMDIEYSQSFDDNRVRYDAGGGVTLDGTFSNARGVFKMKSSTQTIPVEVSTYARFLYAFTLYGGLGLDIASGNADIDFDGYGKVNGTASTGGGESYDADLSASESASGSPNATNFRGFVGLQLNLPVVGVYLHLNKNLSEDIIGTNVGLNIAW